MATREQEHEAARVLIADPDEHEGLLVRDWLSSAGLTAHHLADGRHALVALRGARVGALLTTLDLPGLDGRKLIRQARELDAGLPIFAICDEDGAERRRQVRDLGADKLLVRPLRRRTLIPTLGRAVARAAPAERAARLRLGALTIDPSALTVTVAGQAPVALTPFEFRLIWVLARAGGAILTRPEIFEAVWGGPMPAGDRSVDSLVRRLRRKLDRLPGAGRALHTHHLLGYRLAAPDLRSRSLTG